MTVPNLPERICFVWNYLNWGGAQIYFLAIIKRAQRPREIKVILPRDSSPDIIAFITQAGASCEFLKYHLLNETPTTLTAKIRRQVWRIRSEIEIFTRILQSDRSRTAFHIELAPWQSWLLICALWLIRAKLFITIHNPLPPASIYRKLLWRLRLGIVSRLSNVRFFPSNLVTKTAMAEWMVPRAIDRMRVTYTAIDPDLIDAARKNDTKLAEMRNQFGLDGGRRNVLCVGQFIDRKGRWVFLEAARLLSSRYENLRFIWLMPEMPDAITQQRIETFGLGPLFRPVLSSEVGVDRLSVLTFLRIADVFTLPSFVEGLPIALLEAMALGIPSVSTSVYAIPEAIKDGETGLLVTPGNAIQLADALERLLTDTSLASEIAARGREFVLKTFDERQAADLVLSTYEEEFANA